MRMSCTFHNRCPDSFGKIQLASPVYDPYHDTYVTWIMTPQVS